MTPRPVNELAASEAPNFEMRAAERVSKEAALANISVPEWEWRSKVRKPCYAKKATAARQMIPAC